MSGRELAKQLLQVTARPARTLHVGVHADAVLRHGVTTATVNFLEKPMSPSVLARKVRAVLDAG